MTFLFISLQWEAENGNFKVSEITFAALGQKCVYICE